MSESTCCTCGYTWPTGQHGGHSCANQLLARVAELEREARNDAVAYRAVLERQNELRAELAALKQPSAGVDERGQFELSAVMRGLDISMFTPPSEKEYRNPDTQSEWQGWQARAQLAAPAGVPDGWRLVPVEPTDAMLKAAKGSGIYDPRVSGYCYELMTAAAPSTAPADCQNPDDVAVDLFASVMKQKMAKARAKGRSGWNDKARCTQRYLSELLRGHVDKGDPVDVANFCMMLSQRGEGIAPASDVVPVQRELLERLIVSNSPYQFDPKTYWPAHKEAEALLNGGRS